jgi:hypothetical protein
VVDHGTEPCADGICTCAAGRAVAVASAEACGDSTVS